MNLQSKGYGSVPPNKKIWGAANPPRSCSPLALKLIPFCLAKRYLRRRQAPHLSPAFPCARREGLQCSTVGRDGMGISRRLRIVEPRQIELVALVCALARRLPCNGMRPRSASGGAEGEKAYWRGW